MATFEDHVGANIDSRLGYALPTLRKNYPDADLVAIPPLKNIWDNKQYSTTYSEGGLIAFCPKTADEETVEACVTYLDWMCTKEGGFTLYHWILKGNILNMMKTGFLLLSTLIITPLIKTGFAETCSLQAMRVILRQWMTSIKRLQSSIPGMKIISSQIRNML